jgi:hypothetical protein
VSGTPYITHRPAELQSHPSKHKPQAIVLWLPILLLLSSSINLKRNEILVFQFVLSESCQFHNRKNMHGWDRDRQVAPNLVSSSSGRMCILISYFIIFIN